MKYDRACKNQPSSRIKITLFFQLCSFITHDSLEITSQFFTIYAEFNGEFFKAYRMLIFCLELDIFIVI